MSALGFNAADEWGFAGVIQAAGNGLDLVPRNRESPQHLIPGGVLGRAGTLSQVLIRRLANDGLACVRVLHREVHGIKGGLRFAGSRSSQWHVSGAPVPVEDKPALWRMVHAAREAAS